MLDKVVKWLEIAKVAVEENTKKQWPGCELNWATIDWKMGSKFIRVTTKKYDDTEKGQTVFMFIDPLTGDIYKPAGWSGRAKGVRANTNTYDPNKLDGSSGFLYN